MYAFLIIWSNYNLNEKIHKDIILDRRVTFEQMYI